MDNSTAKNAIPGIKNLQDLLEALQAERSEVLLQIEDLPTFGGPGAEWIGYTVGAYSWDAASVLIGPEDLRNCAAGDVEFEIVSRAEYLDL